MTALTTAYLVTLPFDIAGAILLIWAFIRLIKRHRQERKPQPIPSKTYYAAVGDQVWYAYVPGTAHAIGSPEYHADVIGALKALSERLTSEGQPVPSQIIADVAHQLSKEFGQS
jgi:hypothetical protein